METEILAKLQENERKLDEIYRSVERMGKNFLWTLFVSIVLVVLPIIGLFFAIPSFLGIYADLGALQ